MQPTTATMTHAHFWLCTIGLILVWIVVITTAMPRADKSAASFTKYWNSKNQVQEKRLENSCKALCEQCGCIGFYCGEQCLCEYTKLTTDQRASAAKRANDTKATRSKRDTSDRECLLAMHSEAKAQRLPYEVLIQGPSNVRFMRNAMQLAKDMARTAVAAAAAAASEVEAEQRNKVAVEPPSPPTRPSPAPAAPPAPAPKKRSTISIFRPFAPPKVNQLFPSSGAGKQSQTFEDVFGRPRRSTERFDWFSDLTNNLVRPAPRNKAPASSVNKKRETQRRNVEQDEVKRESLNSWFTDHHNILLRPAPLFRRRATEKAATLEDTGIEDSKENPLAPMQKIIKDTLRNIQQTTVLGENTRQALEDSDMEDSKENPWQKVIKDTLRNIQQTSGLGENMRQGVEDSGMEDSKENPLQKVIKKTLRNIQQSGLAENLRLDALDKWMKNQQMTEAPIKIMPAVSEREVAPAGDVMMSWFQPAQFLERVQQALN